MLQIIKLSSGLNGLVLGVFKNAVRIGPLYTASCLMVLDYRWATGRELEDWLEQVIFDDYSRGFFEPDQCE